MRGIKKLDISEMTITRATGCLVTAIVLFLSIKGMHLAPVTAHEAFLFLAMVMCSNIIGDVFMFYSIHHLGIAAGTAVSHIKASGLSPLSGGPEPKSKN